MKTRLLLLLALTVFQISFSSNLVFYDLLKVKEISKVDTDPIAPTLPNLSVCDTNDDGYSVFDLTVQTPLILAAQSGNPADYVVSYHEDATGALVGGTPLSSPYENINNFSQTIYYRIRNVNTNELAFGSFNLVVNPRPLLITPVPYALCDNNQDGFSVFDLASVAFVLQQGNNYNITFHETVVEAENDFNAINSPYQNINPFSQTIYARGEDVVTGCYNVVPVQLDVYPSPVAASLNSIEVCDQDANPNNAITVVDLTVQIPDVLASQALPSSNYIVNFFMNQANAEAGISPIITMSNYIGANGQTIWYRVEESSTGCYAVGSFQLVINVALMLTTPTALAVCDNDASPNDQTTVFDLTVKDNEITQGLAGCAVTYYPSLLFAQSGENAIFSPTNYVNVSPSVQTLGVRVTSPSGCISITTLNIRVLPIPVPNTNPPALVPQCDVNYTGDLMEVFDLTVNAVYIANGDPTLTFHYFYSLIDAVNGINEILTPTAALVGGNVWIKVENNRIDYMGNHCYVLVEQPLMVNPLPNPIIFTENGFNTVYVDGDDNVVQPLLLDSGVSGNYSYQWYLNGSLIMGANNSTYLVQTATANNEDRVFSVTVTNNDTNCDSTATPFVVYQSDGVPPPSGAVSQTLTAGSTLADIVVSGTNVQWYASSSADRNVNSVPLPLNTLLIDGMTYYASQTINGIESDERLPVTVHLSLGIGDNDILPIQYAPNPVKNGLTLQSNIVLKSVLVYTMLGQKVFEQSYDNTNVTIDLSDLNNGNYILKVESETAQKTLRIVKE